MTVKRCLIYLHYRRGSRGSARTVTHFPTSGRGQLDLPTAVRPRPPLVTFLPQRVEHDRPKARREQDVHDEVGRVIDAREYVGRVQHDSHEDGPMDELTEEGHDHARRLAHDEDHGDDEERASEPSLPHTSAGTRSDSLARDLLGVDEQHETDVENEHHDDDDDVTDGELDDGGDYRRGFRLRIFPAHPPGAFLRDAEEEVVAVRYADAQEQNGGDGARPRHGAEMACAVRVCHHDDSLHRETRDQPVGEIARNAVEVVGKLAVDVGEVHRWPYDVDPLEPDAEQLEVHDAEVGHGEGQ